MKKRLILLPFLMLALAACNPIETGTSSNNDGTTPSPSSSDTTSVTVTSISASYPEDSSTYRVGESFSITPLVVTAHMSDNTDEQTDAYTTSISQGYVFTEDDIGIFRVNVIYNLDETISTYFQLTIVEPSATLESIEIAHNPNKTHYSVGETYNPAGLVVNAVYSDATRVPVTNYNSNLASGYIFKSEDVGVITSVTITYQDEFEASFNIVISLEETIEEKCDNINILLASSSIVNPFEARDYLIDEGYGYVVDPQENSKFFGYDFEDNNVVIYNMTVGNTRNVLYPTSSVGHEIVSYQVREVNSKADLNEAVTNVGIGVGNYSTIKITGNITLDATIAITSSEPFEFDFTNKTVDSSVNKDIFRINGDNCVVNFKGNGGGIETIVDEESRDLGDQTAPACISAFNFKSIIIDNVKLICNARYGYSIIDSLYASNDSQITVKNCNEINALTNAICIVKSTLDVNDSYIRGVVNISGGHITIKDTTVAALARHDDATGLVPDSLVIERATYVYDNNYSKYGSYSVSAPDAIIVFDRRGKFDTYENPIVTIKDSTLIADYDSTHVYGYGLRYIDLHLGSMTTVGKVHLEGTVTFSSCATPESPQGAAGGYNVELPQ